jgi:DNA-binding beta-propeller fold protein YncE
MTSGRCLVLAVAAAAAAGSCGAQPQSGAGGPAPLALERTIHLPDVAGRIDHLAYDARGRRLFVAELGNGTVEAIDLASGRVAGRISGLHEPQGVAWLDAAGELAVAGGDGTLGFYRGNDLGPVATMNLGADADNLRVDPGSGMLAVGFGSGAIALIDPARHAILRSLALPAHPEGFRLDGDRVYVNLPNAGRIVAGDLASGRLTASWSTGLRRLNFPMAFEPVSRTLAVAFRFPSRLSIIDPVSGDFRQTLATCGDSDDLFFDAGRRRLYVICGSGDVDIFEVQGSGYAHAARLRSRAGARTGLLVPQEDRLFVAARAQGNEMAAILVYRPQP